MVLSAHFMIDLKSIVYRHITICSAKIYFFTVQKNSAQKFIDASIFQFSQSFFSWQSSPNYDILCYRKRRSFSASVQISYYIIYPNGGNAKVASFARGADGQPIREQMLLQSLPAARAVFPRYPLIII